MIPYYHNIGPGPCLGVAWHWKEEPKDGELMAWGNILDANGEKIALEMLFVCQNCLVTLSQFQAGGCG